MELNEKLKAGEQIIGKSNRAMETSNVNMSQLMRRISVLQEEIDSTEKRDLKNLKIHPMFTPNAVFYDTAMVEDKTTIDENARLFYQLNEKDEKHRGGEEVPNYETETDALNHELEPKQFKI